MILLLLFTPVIGLPMGCPKFQGSLCHNYQRKMLNMGVLSMKLLHTRKTGLLLLCNSRFDFALIFRQLYRFAFFLEQRRFVESLTGICEELR